MANVTEQLRSTIRSPHEIRPSVLRSRSDGLLQGLLPAFQWSLPVRASYYPGYETTDDSEWYLLQNLLLSDLKPTRVVLGCLFRCLAFYTSTISNKQKHPAIIYHQNTSYSYSSVGKTLPEVIGELCFHFFNHAHRSSGSRYSAWIKSKTSRSVLNCAGSSTQTILLSLRFVVFFDPKRMRIPD